MKVKKIILAMVSTLIVLAIALQSNVFATTSLPEPTVKLKNLNYSEDGITEYSIGINNGVDQTAIKKHEIADVTNGGKTTIKDAYCVWADKGFEKRATIPSDETSHIDTYTAKYDMNATNTQAKQYIKNADSNVTYDGVSANKYKAILELTNLFLLEEDDYENYIATTLKNAMDSGRYSTNPGYQNLVALKNRGASNVFMTAEQIRAVQQFALWYFTEYGNSQYMMTDQTGWIQVRDTNETSYTLSAIKVTDFYDELPAIDNEACDLYNYLIRTAIANANNNVAIDNNVYLYTNPTDANNTQPIIMIKKVNKEFDLALRKYISSVTTNGTTTNYTASGERMPNVDSSTIPTTATYKHRKDPVVVEKGSKVNYRLVIYNEGEIDGRATKVVDQLPAGVKFLSVVSGNFVSDGTYTTSNNKLTLVRKSGNTTDLAAYTSGTPANEVIEIQCEVTADPDENNDKIYTNIAWIAEHASNRGTYTDRDSVQTQPLTTLPSLVTTNVGYTGKTTYTTEDQLANKNTYYKGQEDDDDFEKIKIKSVKGSYNIVLVKQDKNGEDLNSTATFEVDGVSKQVTGRLTIVSNKAINASNVNKVDTYIIKETVPPDEYCKFDGTIKIEVYKKQSGEKYVVDRIKYYVDNVEVTSNRDDLDVYLNTDGNIYVEVKDYQFDLALRKFITKINDTNITDREPSVTAAEKTKLGNKQATYDNGTTAAKTHKKDKLGVAIGDTVVYTIRVYNEGEIDGYASEVTDYLPDGLKLKDYTSGDGSINDVNGWHKDGQKITTTKLNNQLIKAYNKDTNTLDYKDLKIECIVDTDATATNLKNIAEITGHKDKNGKTVTDRDSQPKNVTTNPNNYNPKAPTGGKGEQDDDDFEDLKLEKLDLALRKFITKVSKNADMSDATTYDRTPNVENISNLYNENVLTATYKHTKKPVEVEVGDYVEYTLRVYNEGSMDGYAKEVVDYLPPYLEFVNSGVNKTTYNWTSTDGRTIKTNYLADTKLSAVTSTKLDSSNQHNKELKIICRVKSTVPSEEIQTNVAQISKYGDKNGRELTVDRDSQTTGNGYVTVTDSDLPGYKGHSSNKEDLSDSNYHYKGKQDDDDFEKVIVYKKPEIHKGVKTVQNQDSGYDANEEHTWVINSTIPGNIANYKKYVITDDVDYRLKYVANSVNVKIGNTTLTEGTDYKLEYTPNTNANATSTLLNGKYSGKLTLTFIDTQNTDTTKRISVSNKLTSNTGKKIEVTFKTTFATDSTGKLLAELGTNVPNRAELEFDNGSGSEKIPTEIPEVHTGGVTLFKYVKEDETKVGLEGAEFKIFKSREDAETWTDDDNSNNATAIQTKNSDENGLVEFTGLKYGGDAKDSQSNYRESDNTYVQDRNGDAVKAPKDRKIPGTKYYIVETKAPKNYKLNKTVREVTIDANSYKTVIAEIPEANQVENIPEDFDLALRKFITQVDGQKNRVITDRIPEVKYDKEAGKITYNHPKDPVMVVKDDVVTYTLRIFNEGKLDGFASMITDDIPDGVEFLPDHTTNKEYKWVMYAELPSGAQGVDPSKVVELNINEENEVKKYVETTDPKAAKIIRTDYLSRQNGIDKMKEGDTVNPNLLKAFDPTAEITDTAESRNPDYRDIKVAFRVTEKNGSERILINYAQISEDEDENGKPVKDIDSTTDRWIKDEDDQDIEKIRVPNFDLALRKWVTQAIVTENGKTSVTETGHDAWDDPEEIVKVELHRKKLSNVTVKFRYSIRVYNQGEIEGYAKEVKDHIPEGLKFVAEDNPDWKDEGNNVITTKKLENTLLKPGEFADVEVLLTWINGNDNLGLKINYAEISKDFNDWGVPDKDSTPDNMKEKHEDDDDEAPVMLSVSTGHEVTYIILGTAVLVVIAGGIALIKKYVM